MPALPLIGYFPKRVVPRPDWIKSPRVTTILSVSDCVSTAPDDWINHWTHNDLWVYSTIAAARAVIPPADLARYEIHAYRMLPHLFAQGQRQPFTIPPLNVEPLPPHFQSVGFDAVSRSCGSSFECSPLSCNSMADEIETNEYCLLPTLPIAESIALRFSSEEPEPGPYHVFEVLRPQPLHP